MGISPVRQFKIQRDVIVAEMKAFREDQRDRRHKHRAMAEKSRQAIQESCALLKRIGLQLERR